MDDDGNYKVIVKKDIDHTVEIPDTWGEVKIDLGGHTITGDKADDNNAAKPGLDFVKDGSINEHPGTKLEIVNGTIKGGDGSAKHPDGAPGIGAAGNAADAGLIIGNDAKVIGGNGADGSDADGSDADGIQEEESIHADSDSVENGTDSDSHIPFGECGFHWIPIVWLLVILGYTVVRVKKLRDESEEA